MRYEKEHWPKVPRRAPESVADEINRKKNTLKNPESDWCVKAGWDPAKIIVKRSQGTIAYYLGHLRNKSKGE